MTFNTLGGMFSHYYEVKESLASCRTNTPQSEVLREEIFTSNPQKARSAMEYKMALVADIELYIKRLEWYEGIILTSRMKPHGEKQIPWRKIAKMIRADYRSAPRTYSHHQKIFELFRDKILPLAEDHFRVEGYLR